MVSTLNKPVLPRSPHDHWPIVGLGAPFHDWVSVEKANGVQEPVPDYRESQPLVNQGFRGDVYPQKDTILTFSYFFEVKELSDTEKIYYVEKVDSRHSIL